MNKKISLLEHRLFLVKLGQLHFTPQMTKSTFGEFQTKNLVWSGMLNRTQIKILISDLSRIWLITTCKKIWRHLLFLSETLMIIEFCYMIGQDHFRFCVLNKWNFYDFLNWFWPHSVPQGCDVTKQIWQQPTKNIIFKFVISFLFLCKKPSKSINSFWKYW